MAEELQSAVRDSARPTDPNALQRCASDPNLSVWVGASAGTGKTKVLTDRVLRLLLPAGADTPGTPPHKILCLTFTKAGASEMAIRIAGALSRWAVMPEGDQDQDEGRGQDERRDKTLRHELRDLLGRPAQRHEIRAARRLFASVVDHPGGLPIMTIHAFCQSLLGRFPLEAGLNPHFRVLEDGPAAELLLEARMDVLEEARSQPGSPLAGALDRLARTLNEEQFFNLLADIQSERREFARLLRQHFGAEGLYAAICAFLDTPPGAGAQDLRLKACEDGAFDKLSLEAACRVLGKGGGTKDAPRAQDLRDWLDAAPQDRLALYPRYRSVFFTKSSAYLQKLSKMLPAAMARENPDLDAAMWAEAARLEDLKQAENRAECALLSRALFVLAEAVAARYQFLKDRQGGLDFDDLILRTLALLKGGTQPGLRDMAGWVNFKLDQGLDHLLVDEAQDTNPEQWGILEALCDDFFSGAGGREGLGRSVFVVGDEKQSIYSFQRASPREFARMKAFFTRKLAEVQSRLETVDMKVSFRSVPAVLGLVDAVFADEDARKGLGGPDISHMSHRLHQAGLVEIWPLAESPGREKTDYWQLPLPAAGNAVEKAQPQAQDSGAVQLARRIADTVAGWLEQGETLPSRGRAIRPGDIMILLKNRRRGVPIMQALKARGIPVGGADRMILGEQLAVEDMLAAASFALLPEDDLTLACLLKSPLIGLGEEDLFALACGRRGSLWTSVREKAPEAVREYLAGLIRAARARGPYAFLSFILGAPCPGHERSGLAAMTGRLGRHALDPLEELLEAAQGFESMHPASLQLFLDWQRRQDTEIKREMENAGEEDGSPGFVRIMTVHGSKGLQAPIVILPDTVRTAKSASTQNQRRLLWPHQSELDLPLWSPRKDTDFDIYSAAMARLEEKEDEEYRRLLYVAMTRAEDRLYIGGAIGGRKAMADSWYFSIRKGFERLGNVETLEDGTLRYADSGLNPPDRVKQAAKRPDVQADLPGWALHPPAHEPSPPRPLAPSRPSLPDQPVRSPLDGVCDQLFLRGNLTHKLLQFLPDLAPEKREAAGRQFLGRSGAGLAEDARANILAEVLAILRHPDFAALFGPGSLAEVPVSGMTAEGVLISGQIDRLLVSETKILIVDYKTGRAPPAQGQDIPPAYLRQMQSYAALLREIYPGRAVACALVWTDGPVLMPVDAAA